MLQGGVLKFHFPPFQGSSVSRAYLKKVKKKRYGLFLTDMILKLKYYRNVIQPSVLTFFIYKMDR